MKRIITRWVLELGLDGWFFDAPDGYIGAGNAGQGFWQYNPAVMRAVISDVIHEVSGNRSAAFAEVYNDPPLLEAFGFDGGLGDSKLCASHSAKTCPASPRAGAIGAGVTTGNATLVHTTMTGPGSVDDMAAHQFRAPGTVHRSAKMTPDATASWLPGAPPLGNGLNCSGGAGASYAPADLDEPVPLLECFARCKTDPKCDAVRVDWLAVQQNWSARRVGCGLRGGIELENCTVQKRSNTVNVRYSTFAANAPDNVQLTVALSTLSGYRTEPQHLWSAAPKPGDSGGMLPALLPAVRVEPAFRLGALRVSVPAASLARARRQWPLVADGKAEVRRQQHTPPPARLHRVQRLLDALAREAVAMLGEVGLLALVRRVERFERP